MTEPTTIITTSPTETVKVTYDGKEYNLSIQFIQDDDVLRQILSSSGLAGAANALVERQADGSILMVKRGGPNGVPVETAESEMDAFVGFEPTAVVAGIVERLLQLTPHINPAVQSDWELRQLEWRQELTLTKLLLCQGQIDKAITDGRAEKAMVAGIESRLGDCGSIPDQQVPGLM